MLSLFYFLSDCEIAATSDLGQDKELAKKLYLQTIEILKKVTKLEIDEEHAEGDSDTDSELEMAMEMDMEA